MNLIKTIKEKDSYLKTRQVVKILIVIYCFMFIPPVAMMFAGNDDAVSNYFFIEYLLLLFALVLNFLLIFKVKRTFKALCVLKIILIFWSLINLPSVYYSVLAITYLSASYIIN